MNEKFQKFLFMTAKILQKIGFTKTKCKKDEYSFIIAQHLYSFSVLNGFVCLNGEPLKNSDLDKQITANKIIEKMKEKDDNILLNDTFKKLKKRLKSHYDSSSQYPILVAELNGYELETNLCDGEVFYDCFHRFANGKWRGFQLTENQLQELHNLLLKEKAKQEQEEEYQARMDYLDELEAEDNRKHLDYESQWLTHNSITLN